jgi:low affinity Fe/Cu permease
MNSSTWYSRTAKAASRFSGKPAVFVLAVGLILGWIITGPLFGFSDTWQLVINTSTTIITFLMVFLIQNTQNRDNNAIQAKLDELIRVGRAHNRFIGIENLPDEELERILAEFDKINTRLRDEAVKLPDAPARKTRTSQARRPAAKAAAKPRRAPG